MTMVSPTRDDTASAIVIALEMNASSVLAKTDTCFLDVEMLVGDLCNVNA